LRNTCILVAGLRCGLWPEVLMKCGQGKPFKSYQTGGLVTKGPAKAASAPKVPQDVDMISSLKGKERADAEKRMGVKPPAPRASEAKK